MPFVVRHRCHACGGPCDSKGEVTWIRCTHCRALLGFDWQAWMESAEYAAFLGRAKAGGDFVKRWERYQELQKDARKRVGKGDLEKASRLLREGVELLLELSPHVFPPEVRTDAAYRERWARWSTWSQLQRYADPESCRLADEAEAALRKYDYRDPMGSLSPAIELYQRQFVRLESLPGGPEDPDGMPPSARTRVSMSLLLTAWLQMLKKGQRLELLRRIYGPANVKEVGAGQDEGGLYLDWACPRCGLVSIQARMAPLHVCPGCTCRRRVGSGREALAAVEVQCPNCGADARIDAGALEAECAWCSQTIERAARTNDAERQLAREAGADAVGEADGMEVTAENRREMLVRGLARQAAMFASMIDGERYLSLVRATFPALGPGGVGTLIEEVEAALNADGLPRSGLELLSAARGLARRGER